MIFRMIRPLIRQRVSKVHLFLRQRQRRLIAHDIPAVIWFDQDAGIDGILVFILDHEAFRIGALIALDLFIGRQHDVVVDDPVDALGLPHRTADVTDIRDVHAAVEGRRPLR